MHTIQNSDFREKCRELKKDHIYKRNRFSYLDEDSDDDYTDEETFRIKCVNLREGSWYGDY